MEPDSSARRAEGELAWRTALAVAPGVLIAGCAGGIVFPILPIVGARVGLPLAFIGLILASNRITRVLTTPVIGWLTDRIGSRRTMLWGLVIQIVVMLLFALGSATTHTGALFLLGRIVHGPGSACVFVAGQALALTAGGVHYRGRATGAVRAALGVGVPFGLVLGGLISDRYGDTRTFEIAAALMFASTVASYFSIPDLRVARRATVPLKLAIRALADRRLAVLGVLNFAGSFCATGMVLTTTALLVSARHLSLFGRGAQGTAGAAMGIMTLVDAAAMLIAGRIGDRRRAYAHVALFGIVLFVPALLVIAWSSSVDALVLGLVLVGIASGALGPSLLALVADVTTADNRALGISGLQVAGDIGGSLGPLVGTALFANNVSLPYVLCAFCALAVVPAAAWLTKRRASRDP
ncbi:MAG: MFS transporter [Polyangia bacterium]